VKMRGKPKVLLPLVTTAFSLVVTKKALIKQWFTSRVTTVTTVTPEKEMSRETGRGGCA
jgi:hypothetical protein